MAVGVALLFIIGFWVDETNNGVTAEDGVTTAGLEAVTPVAAVTALMTAPPIKPVTLVSVDVTLFCTVLLAAACTVDCNDKTGSVLTGDTNGLEMTTAPDMADALAVCVKPGAVPIT